MFRRDDWNPWWEIHLGFMMESRQTKLSNIPLMCPMIPMKIKMYAYEWVINQQTNQLIGIHPKSGGPGSPDSANYFDFPQSYSLRTRKLPNLLCWILSGRAIALKMFWFWFWIFYCSIGTPQKVRTKCIKHISRVFTTKISKYLDMKWIKENKYCRVTIQSKDTLVSQEIKSNPQKAQMRQMQRKDDNYDDQMKNTKTKKKAPGSGWWDANVQILHLFNFSPMCASRCNFKLLAWTNLDSHRSHLFVLFFMCVFKCLLKLLAQIDS